MHEVLLMGPFVILYLFGGISNQYIEYLYRRENARIDAMCKDPKQLNHPYRS